MLGMAYRKSLLACLLVSLLLHALVFVLPVDRKGLGGGAWERSVGRIALVVELSGKSLAAADANTGMPQPSALVPQWRQGGKPSDASGLIYLPASALDQLPEMIGDVDHEFDSRGAKGYLILKLQVGADGNVVDAKVLTSTLAAELEPEITRRFRQARFRPGEIAGRPVGSEIIIQVDVE